MTDPLGTADTDAVSDAQALVTANYVPLLIGAIVFGVVLRIGFKWLRRAVRTAGG